MTHLTKICASLKQTIILTLSLAVLTFNANAEVSLSPKVIEQWIESQRSLESWGDKHDELLAKYEEQTELPDNPFEVSIEAMLAPLKQAGLFSEAKAIVEKHGFASLEEWAQTTLLITKAAAAIEFEKIPNTFDPAALQGMLDNANMPAEQKAMLENAMKQNAIMMEVLNKVDTKQKDLVRPYLERITQLMEGDEMNEGSY